MIIGHFFMYLKKRNIYLSPFTLFEYKKVFKVENLTYYDNEIKASISTPIFVLNYFIMY